PRPRRREREGALVEPEGGRAPQADGDATRRRRRVQAAVPGGGSGEQPRGLPHPVPVDSRRPGARLLAPAAADAHAGGGAGRDRARPLTEGSTRRFGYGGARVVLRKALMGGLLALVL